MRLQGPLASSSLRLTVLLVIVLALPAGTLVWLGVRLAKQDREDVARQATEERQVALRSVAQSLALSLARAEQDASSERGGDEVTQFTLHEDGLRASPTRNVLWLPQPPALPEVDDPLLDRIESLEYGHDQSAALTRYAEIIDSSSATPALRAGALLGRARIQRQARAWDAALASYAQLEAMDNLSIASAPVELQARRARCAVLAEAGRPEALRDAARLLERDWLAGRWPLDRVSWELVAADLTRWTGTEPTVPARRAAFSTAGQVISSVTNEGLALPQTLTDAAGAVIVLWRRPGEPSGALAVTAGQLERWLSEATAAAGLPRAAASVRLDHATIPASASQGDDDLLAIAAATGLPWPVAVHLPPDDLAVWTRGQVLLTGSLAALLLFVLAGGYVIARLVRQEVAVARLQSEFVAAVSHEFRTPLASIRHLTELLDESDELPLERRRAFYGALTRNTERLRRLVESLLDFSRMESGRASYRLAAVDISELVGVVVADFRHDLRTRGAEASISIDAPRSVTLSADAPSLALALWNLLENAVKYSEGAADIRVTVIAGAGRVTIAVRDHGLGIPKSEHALVFRRFARGAVSQRLGIKGTGIGLAIVSHVVRGHGGDVSVASEEGDGAEFRIVLPLAPGELPARSPSLPDPR